MYSAVLYILLFCPLILYIDSSILLLLAYSMWKCTKRVSLRCWCFRSSNRTEHTDHMLWKRHCRATSLCFTDFPSVSMATYVGKKGGSGVAESFSITSSLTSLIVHSLCYPVDWQCWWEGSESTPTPHHMLFLSFFKQIHMVWSVLKCSLGLAAISTRHFTVSDGPIQNVQANNHIKHICGLDTYKNTPIFMSECESLMNFSVPPIKSVIACS